MMHKFSVCMATYNGEAFLEKQISSIISQMGSNDELIIVDDNSKDNTIKIIHSFDDNRIKLYFKKGKKGEVKSFSDAMLMAENDFIFLSDQDDIWLPGRAKEMIEALSETNSLLLTSNFTWVDSKEHPVDVSFDGVLANHSEEYFQNILEIFYGKTNYFGCAMLMRKEILKYILPIPAFVESHDLWIAFAANLRRLNLHLEKVTFLKRIHENNATSTVSSRPIWKKFFSRIIFVLSILVLYVRFITRASE